MRQLAQFDDERQAQRLGDVLFARDIENDVMETRDGTWAVWVHRDDQLDDARSLADRLAEAPSSSEVRELEAEAEAKRKQLREERKRSRHREVDMRTKLHTDTSRTPYVTWSLIGVCVLVAVVTKVGANRDVVAHLLIGHPLWAIQQGEPWRLVTPIFLHFGWMHLLFNMWWMNDLGTALERWHGSFYLLSLVFVSGVLSNLAQLFLEGSPFFGGMSGVVYALLGFIWTRGRFDPRAHLRLHKHIMIFMLVWMGLGFVGLFSMANYAHLGGLVVGGAWGYLTSGDLKRRLGG